MPSNTPATYFPPDASEPAMSFLTHATFSIMLLLALLAGLWSHQR